MAIRVEVITKGTDTRATTRKKNFLSLLHKGTIDSVYIRDVYTIDKKLTSSQLKKVTDVLINPIVQGVIHNSETAKTNLKKAWTIEVGYLPGVTDNIATTAREMIEDALSIRFENGEGVYYSQMTIIDGNIRKEDVELLSLSLANPLIQRIHIVDNPNKLQTIIPQVKLKTKPRVTHVNLSVSDKNLEEIGSLGIKDSNGTHRGPLALDLPYMKAIQEYFKKKRRNPTDIELESIAQTWSEHCKHTIFADPLDDIKHGLYKTYIKGATQKIRKEKGDQDFCVSVFTDNSGAINFDDDFLVTHKVETHNSPSALDPFGGAVTGIVGVNRDAIGFGLGAKPIVNTYGFCVGNPDDTRRLYKDKQKKFSMLYPRQILDGVVAGVNYGGNCSGIPTPHGFVYFDDNYRGKPLVFAGTVGLIPKKTQGRLSYKKKAGVGDYIVMVGGRVGKDGIHGATFSSTTLDLTSPATAVQIGDPITQKKLSDAIVKEARDMGLYTSITDNGAGGLSCSVAEMARECGGCIVDLDKVPLKYPGLSPWEIWISESQERMTLSVPVKNWSRFKKLMDQRGVEATRIGKFVKAQKCKVYYRKKKILDLDMEFLHDGLPKKNQISEIPSPMEINSGIPSFDIQSTAKEFMGLINLSSTEYIANQYDHEVQASSVIKPLQGPGRVLSDAAVVRPVLTSLKGVVLSSALYPSYSEQDSYRMAACSVDTAVRNAVAAGADMESLALLDNFCWCSSKEPKRLGQLKSAVIACFDTAVVYGTPFISGKDSMFNDFKGFDESGAAIKVSIPPTLLVSSIGVISDATKVISQDFKVEGDLIYIIGDTFDELGGSVILEHLSKKTKKQLTGVIPSVNAEKNKVVYRKFYKAVQKKLVASAVSLSRGGLLAGAYKSAIGGMIGFEISLKGFPGGLTSDVSALFSESQGRMLVSINPKNKVMFEKCLSGVSHKQIGKVTKSRITIYSKNGQELVSDNVEDTEQVYKRRFKNY